MIRKISVIVLYNNKKEILLQKKTLDYELFPGKWVLFGGLIENNETPKQAIIREIKEELDLDINPEYHFDLNLKIKDQDEKVYVFSSELNDLSLCRLKEGAGFAFFSEKEIFSEINLIPDMLEVLKKYFK